MTDLQNEAAATYVVMGNVASQYPEVTILVPYFHAGMVRLNTISALMASLGIQQSKNLTGITEGKNLHMGDLIQYSVSVAGAVYSFATIQNDPDTQAKVNYKLWQFNGMNQAALMHAAGVVLDEAKKIDPLELAKGGISAAEITAFEAAYMKYSDKRFNPREARIDRGEYTDQIAELFTEAYNLKKNTLDRLAVQFKQKSPEFYRKYITASMIIHHPGAPTTPKETPPAV